MKQKPSKLRHSGKNIILFFVAIVFCLGPIALCAFIINRYLTYAHVKYIRQYSKYKINYENQITPYLDEENDYVFKTNKKLKILQLTDLHIGGGLTSFKKDRLAIDTMAKMIICEKPDLVIVTGDIAFPVFIQAGAIANLNQQRLLAKLLNTLGVYWTFVFGNHDSEVYSPYSRFHIVEWYKKQQKKKEEYKYCIFKDDPYDNISGYGNQFIKVVNENNKNIQNLILLDTHAYAKGNLLGLKSEYDNLKPDQVKWALKKVNEVENRTKEMVKSLVFIHIPLVEYRDAYSEYRLNGESDTVKIVSGKVDRPEDKYNKYNEKTWGINASSDRSDLFETLRSVNTLQAVFCGHDHKNDICMIYKGVTLSYCKPIDYLAYPGLIKQKRYRGCNVIFVNEDGSFTSMVKDFYNEQYQKLEINFNKQSS